MLLILKPYNLIERNGEAKRLNGGTMHSQKIERRGANYIVQTRSMLCG